MQVSDFVMSAGTFIALTQDKTNFKYAVCLVTAVYCIIRMLEVFYG